MHRKKRASDEEPFIRELKAVNERLSREIAERQEAQARLRASEERYRNLVESSSDWIWEVDRNGAYTYSSPSIRSILGYTPEEMIGRTFYDVMPPDEVTRVQALFEAKSSAGESFTGLINRCRHKDGTERILETNGEPVMDAAGAVVGYRGIDRDTTLRTKHAEESRKMERLESLGLLAGGIAHDFNNLLTGVFGNVDLARGQLPAGSEAEQALSDSLVAMEQARNLTGQLLTFSKGGSPVLKTASVRDLLRDACGFALSGSSIKCEYNVPDVLWMAEIDSGQIWQVLNNILVNAREAMPGGGTLWVDASNAHVGAASALPLPPGDYVTVSFRDDGVGIAEVDISHVFDPYFSTKTRGATKGTGIGLAVSLSIVQKHGGHIMLDSTPGEGTTVTLYLCALDAPPRARRDPSVEPRTPSGARHVLMLEDDEVVITTTTRMLEHLGHSVDVVRDGAAAIDRYARAQREGTPFDFVILDLTIRGGMGGVEALQGLKEADPGVVGVVTSGYTADSVMADFKQHGFHAALPKPFSVNELSTLINRL